MSFSDLFIRTKRSVGGVQLDAVISETHDNRVSLTTNPVEFGADITDHSFIEPKKIRIVGEVSDTPLGLAALGEIVDNISGLFGTATTDSQTRSVAAYNALVQLQETREPLQIQTKLRLYQNMIITRLSTTQDKDSSKIANMVIDLQEVNIVETQIISISPEQLESGDVRDQGTSANERGRLQPVEPDPEIGQSLLRSIAGYAGAVE